MAAQDYRDILEPFDYIVQMLKDAQPALGLEYIAENDEELLPAYPAVLVQADRTERTRHTTGQFMVRFYVDLFIFHADIASGAAVRSRKDIQLATDVRKLLHTDRTLGGHLIDSMVDGEFPGFSARMTGNTTTGIVTTRLTWNGQCRVPYELS